MTNLDDKTWAAVMHHKDTELAPPASTAAIDTFEASFRVRLPFAHREFLMRGNGGIFGFVRLFGIQRSDSFDLQQRASEIRPYLEETSGGPILPFANDWGGSYFCYDLRESIDSIDYQVLLWKHEYSEEPEDRPKLWSVFAPNFVAFVKEVLKD